MRKFIALVIAGALVLATGAVAVVLTTHYCVRRSSYPPLNPLQPVTINGAKELWESAAKLDREYDRYTMSTISEDACTHRLIVEVKERQLKSAQSYPERAAGHYLEIVGTLRLVKAGWPFHMLEGEEFWCEYESSHNSLKDDELPLRPMLPQFVMGSVLYGVVIWLPIVFLFRVLARLQRRVGYCSRCGYDLRASVLGACSECGFPVRTRRDTHAR